MRDGIINGQLASLLARFRHVNSIAIVDGPFPSYLDVETVDLDVKKGFPTIPQILDLILPDLDITSVVMAKEFDTNAVNALRRLAQSAKLRGISLGLEPVNRYESSLINTADQCLNVISDIGEDNVLFT